MLLAHLAPGYFAATQSQPTWKSEWSRKQRALLWLVALGSTVAPDFDVIYNLLFRGFFNHSFLWTHSLFPYLGLAFLWWLLGFRGYSQNISARSASRFSLLLEFGEGAGGGVPYLRTLLGLAAVGGLSHVLLDVIAHSTPIFYPLSTVMIGAPSVRVLQGGVWGYLTDPIFLLEPLLLVLAGVHWALSSKITPRPRALVLVVLVNGLLIFVVTFLMFLPDMQRTVAVP